MTLTCQMSKVLVRRLGGNVGYNEGLLEQSKAIEHLRKQLNESDKLVTHTLLTLQHSPVYTVGHRQRDEDLDRLEERLRRDTQADFVRSQRGGLITFHGPGQLVVYPVLHLPSIHRARKAMLGVKWYVNQMEQVVIDSCHELGLVDATRSPHTGVWIGDNKVCAMGFKNAQGIVWHGLALNCNVDLSYFDHIVACGIEGKGVTSISEVLKRNVDVHEAEHVLLKHFSRLLNCNLFFHTQ